MQINYQLAVQQSDCFRSQNCNQFVYKKYRKVSHARPDSPVGSSTGTGWYSLTALETGTTTERQ